MASNDREERIARLLGHYFESVWRKAGVGWDADNSAEIRELAGLICWEPVDLNQPQCGSGACVCSFSPEKQEEAAKRTGYENWMDEFKRGRAGVANLDYRCPKHGEEAQKRLWGRHKGTILCVTAVEWDSLGVKYEEEP